MEVSDFKYYLDKFRLQIVKSTDKSCQGLIYYLRLYYFAKIHVCQADLYYQCHLKSKVIPVTDCGVS
jgi:hypothetical protein